jgi:uncharacterized repeat protein (TIGR02059 family)
MSEDLKALFRRLRKKDLAYYGNLGSGAQGGSGAGGGTTPDTTAPSLQSAEIPSAGTTIVLTYNENLLSTGDGVPDTTDYTISASGGAVTVSSRSVSTTTVTLTLSRTISQGETVTLTYTAGASGRVQDASLNVSSNFTDQAVTNNSTVDTTAPTISSAVVPSAGTTLGLTYNENLLASGDGIPDIADYSVTSGGTLVTISAVSVSGAIVTLNLARTITAGETLSFNYTAGASGRVQDAANNIASNLSSQAVTNNAADTTAPSLSGATDTKTGSSTADLKVVSNETNGLTYYVVTRSATPPTAAQVKSGLDDGGSAAVKTGSISASTTLSWGVTSLSASTTFYAHFMQEDVATNQSTVASGDGFITDAESSGDANWTSVELMVAALAGTSGGTTSNGPDAGTTITDQGPDVRGNLARVGAAWTNTSPPTGLDTSVQMTANTHYFRLSTSLSFAADFTWEMYIRSDSIGSDQYCIYVNNDSIILDSTGVMQFTDGGTIRITGSTTLSANTWYHVAVCRSGSDIKLFLNGTQEGSTYSSASSIGGDWVYMANNNVASGGLVGRMAGVRLTQAARYTGSFTPPTFPYPTSA